MKQLILTDADIEWWGLQFDMCYVNEHYSWDDIDNHENM